jgi:hypothetical protein
VSSEYCEVSPISTIKVGRGSCSNTSTIPIELSSRRCSFLSRSSGETTLELLARSELRVLVTPGGLRPLKVPRARVTVLMPLSSPLVLLSILAAASELENRGASGGRLPRELEKKRGDGGWPVLVTWGGRWKWSRKCPVWWDIRRRLDRGLLEPLSCDGWLWAETFLLAVDWADADSGSGLLDVN